MTDVGNRCAEAGGERLRAGCWSRCSPRWRSILSSSARSRGAVWRFRAPPPWASVVTPNLLGYASTLPPERRKELWERRRGAQPHPALPPRGARRARGDHQGARRRAVRPAAVPGRPGAAGGGENRAREAVQDLYVKIADSLTPEERRGFPRWREHRRRPASNLLDEPDQQAGEPGKR